MATSITWQGGNFVTSISPAESGTYDTLGMFGGGFGLSVRVGEYQDTSWATTDNGSAQNGQVPNVKFATITGCYTPSIIAARLLRDLTNSEATLGIRLTTDTPVQTQNSSFRCFDRLNINSNPSGVTVYSAEIIRATVGVSGSGDTSWTQIFGSGSTMGLDNQTSVTGVHTWYVAVTASPQSIGEKTHIGYYFETEFL